MSRSSRLLLLFGVALALMILPASALAFSGRVTDGKFTRMFPKLKAFTYSDQQAADLAGTMLNPTPDPPGVNNSTPDDSTTVAAWITYQGQFLAHLTDFDSTPQPFKKVNVDALKNDAAGVFNLATIFGRGPKKDPELYAADGTHLLVQCTLGTPFADGFPNVISGNANGACDVARNADGTMLTPPGVVGEGVSRDDENQIISQLQAAWVLFYNHFVDQGMSYRQARDLTEGYFRDETFTQMLPDLVTNQAYINQYISPAFGTSPTGTYTVNLPNDPSLRIPVEFSVGAYRFGHSLVRNAYTLNDIQDGPPELVNNVPIFDVNHFQTGDLTGGAPLQGTAQFAASGCQNPAQSTLLCSTGSDHQIEWKYFFKSLNRKSLDGGLTNQARQTNTTISPNLFNLPAFTIPGCADQADPVCNGSASLISRDFARGNYDGLPSGQDAATELGCPVISAASLNPTSDKVFDKGTPLLYYVLAEAKAANAPLGCVGSKIVTQVFLRALVGKGDTLQLTPATADNLPTTTGQFSFNDQDLRVVEPVDASVQLTEGPVPG